MKQNMNIEAEGNELVLKNKAGDYVIIPKKYRREVQDMINDNCHSCIDKLVETLPIMSDYAEDGTVVPNDKKKFNFTPEKYTAKPDATYFATRPIIPIQQKKKVKYIPRTQTVLKADTRTDQERKVAQEYTESVLNPSISTQIGEAFQKPLRWLADPIKGVGDIVSTVAPNSALAKDLPNTNKETFEHRKKQLNPYTSNRKKISNTFNEAIPLTNWALLNTLPVEAVANNMVKSGKNLIKPVNAVVNKTDNVIKKIKFQEFNNDDEFFRIIVGDDAFDDIVKSNKVRTNYGSKPKNNINGVIDLTNRGTLYPSFSKKTPSFEYAKSNPNHYIIKTADKSIKPSTVGRHGKGTTMFPTDDAGKHLSELDASKVEVYKHIGGGEYTLVFPITTLK